MATEPEELTIAINERDSVTALLYSASKRDRVRVTLILGHGAGADQLSGFMRMFAGGLAFRGFDVMTFNFLYAEQRRRVPDQRAKLESCYRAVIEAAGKHRKLKSNHLVIGGKSMGGRIALQVAAQWTGLTGLTEPDQVRQHSKKSESKPDTGNNEKDETGQLAGLLFLGYPLHPPGKPEQLRDKHLKDIRAPMLFMQGSRDAFGTPDELRAVIKNLHPPATLHVIENGDHSFKVPKSSGVPQQLIYETAMDEIARWLRAK